MARRETEAPTSRRSGTRKRSANCYSLTLRQARLSSTLRRWRGYESHGTVDCCSGDKCQLGWIAADLRSVKSQTHADLAEMRGDIADIRERMARLEGLFEGFTKRETAP